MSILDKPLVAEHKPRRKRWRYLLAGLLLLLIIAFLVSNPANEFAFVQHFVTAPQHLTYSGHSAYVSSLAWSPDGRLIASASGDHTVQIWNASSGTRVRTYRGDNLDLSAVAWSPDGKYLASGDIVGLIQVWNASNGQLAFTYRGQDGAIFSLAWSPDSQDIASASGDGSLQVWQALNGNVLLTVRNPTTARGAAFPQAWNGVAWSPDGRYLAGGTNGNGQVFDMQTRKLFSNAYGYHGDIIHAVAWSPDGQYLATAQASGAVLVWNVASGKNVLSYNNGNDDINSVAWSPDGKRIASGGNDALVQVWDALTGQHAYIYRGHADVYPGHFTSHAAIYAVAWSPDGKRIASGGNDNTVQVWSVPTD
jgi:WD40 repeat protein